MSEQSAISWTDSTFNPWIGCTKVGPGCDHCYAEQLMDVRHHRVSWGAGNPRSRTSGANWKLPKRWNAQGFCECTACGFRGVAHCTKECPHCMADTFEPARRRVFCSSLADVFDNAVDEAWRADLWRLIEATPNLDWLLLTKRVGNAKDMLPVKWLHAMPQNIWLGATAVNQAEADRDIPKLLALPARIRFLSIEPMLGPIDLHHIKAPRETPEDEGDWTFDALNTGSCYSFRDGRYWETGDGPERENHIDWVIAGGESGAHARPSHPSWQLSLRDQCAAAGVPFHFKQWGEWLPMGQTMADGSISCVDKHERDGLWIEDGPMARVGKKAAGRFLDGVEHNGFPPCA